ncbi:MAG: MFS transporter [Coxiellaceae bacterium]|nr:MFS transporter [Coxiellaceae bacterium]
MQRRYVKLYPWFCWFLASSFIFYKYLLQVSPTVMLPELMAAFKLTGASIGTLAAYFFYSYLLMQLPAGILLDQFRPRYLISVAIGICAMGALVFSQSNTLLYAQLGRILMGIGGAFSAVGTMKIISMWFPTKRFALVSGLMMSMAMLGAIGGEAPLSYLISYVGWRNALLFLAIGGFALSLLFFLLIRDNTSCSPTKVSIEKLDWTTFCAGIALILKNKQTWLVALYSGLAFAPVSAFAGLWGTPFIMQKYFITRGAAAGLVSMTFIGFAMGSPLSGWLSDRMYRRKPVMIIGTSISLVALLLIIYSPTLPLFVLATLFLIF